MTEYSKSWTPEKQKEYASEYYKKYHTDRPWLSHYMAALSRCTYPRNVSYKWYGGKGIRMLLTKVEIEILYKRDGAENMKRPSIDRINPGGDYHFGNCRFIEMAENTRWV